MFVVVIAVLFLLAVVSNWKCDWMSANTYIYSLILSCLCVYCNRGARIIWMCVSVYVCISKKTSAFAHGLHKVIHSLVHLITAICTFLFYGVVAFPISAFRQSFGTFEWCFSFTLKTLARSTRWKLHCPYVHGMKCLRWCAIVCSRSKLAGDQEKKNG